MLMEDRPKPGEGGMLSGFLGDLMDGSHPMMSVMAVLLVAAPLRGLLGMTNMMGAKLNFGEMIGNLAGIDPNQGAGLTGQQHTASNIPAANAPSIMMPPSAPKAPDLH